MYEIIDKCFLFLCGTALYIYHSDINYAIVPIILIVIFSSLFIIFEDARLNLAGIVFYAFLCIYVPNYTFFLPILLYDIHHSKFKFGALSLPILLIIHSSDFPPIVITCILIILVASYILKYKTDKLNELHTEYNNLRDSSSEISQLLEEKNRSILKNQDYEINLATLNERNRISKEIHDNIGHLLSRALLQIGALLTISKDKTTRDGLTSLKESLSLGMDQIRNSIHQMYDDSIDLYVQIDHLVKDFSFCNITYEYDISSSPPLPLKHSLIAITKESLANIIRHSNATKVTILLREHPALYQAIIQDNGTMDEKKKNEMSILLQNHDYGNGMGIHNIYDRVKGFHGNMNISLDHGFQLFITIPKEDTK